MNAILPVGSPTDTPLYTGDHLVPDTSLLPGDTPVPLSSAPNPGDWVERVRHTVTGHPLAAVAAAFVLGTVVARVRR